MDAVSRLANVAARISFPNEHGPVCIRDFRGRLRRLERGHADRLRGPDAGGPFAAVSVCVAQAAACMRLPEAVGGPAPSPLEQLIIPTLRRLEGLPAWAAEAILSPEEPLLELVLAASRQPGSLVAVDRLAGGAMAFQPLPGAVSLTLEAIAAAPTPEGEELLDQAMLAEAKACHQRAEEQARRDGKESTASYLGSLAAQEFKAGSNTDIARALVASCRIPCPRDERAWDALRNRISRERKKLVKKDAEWKPPKRKRGSATGGQIAEAKGTAGMSLERRSSENDTRVPWCRNCGISPEDAGQSFCMPCMGRLSEDDRESILDGSARPLSARLTKDALERERSGALQRIAQAAEERKRETSGKAGR
jgi:hypothetical protein